MLGKPKRTCRHEVQKIPVLYLGLFLFKPLCFLFSHHFARFCPRVYPGRPGLGLGARQLREPGLPGGRGSGLPSPPAAAAGRRHGGMRAARQSLGCSSHLSGFLCLPSCVRLCGTPGSEPVPSSLGKGPWVQPGSERPAGAPECSRFQQKWKFFAVTSFILCISYQILVEVDKCCNNLGGTCWCEGKNVEYLQIPEDWQSFKCAVTI